MSKHKLFPNKDLERTTYNDWIERLEIKMNTNKSTVLVYDIPLNRVRDYTFVFTKLLEDLGQSHNYIVYVKRGWFGIYNLKIKPINNTYRLHIIDDARKRWKTVRVRNRKIIDKNPSSISAIVKKTCDRSLAEWYKSVVQSEFVNHIVNIQKIITTFGGLQYQVVINFNININTNNQY